MSQVKSLHAGASVLAFNDGQASGQFCIINGEEFYVINDVQHMNAFFMSIVSDSDHWMFISSNGALTAGRKNPENALFPYYTVDKIHDLADISGSKTIIKAEIKGIDYLWEPLSQRMEGIYNISRNLYKNKAGNKIIFEEVNRDLNLTFSYQWSNSNKFGFVKKSTLLNTSNESVTINLIDGIQNILPYGVNRGMQTSMSSLVDAYKKSELTAKTGVGVYMLSSIPVDRAEPSESLVVNTAWSVGSGITKRMVSSIQLEAFRRGKEIEQETDIRGKRGAYFVNVEKELKPGETANWYIVAEVGQSVSKFAMLEKTILTESNLPQIIEADITAGTLNLTKIVASADGLQQTNDKRLVFRQFSNTMFNVMRGGIFDNAYNIDKSDFLKYAQKANSLVCKNNSAFLDSLPKNIYYKELIASAQKSSDLGLVRLCMEYLPLTFSRRHGDPSRPWNVFSIETQDANGNKILNYQGNWRDIFQNWEALSYSYPEYVESMISKFVNASTIDGYNPYRVTRDGFDWEIHDPHDPWSFIGYWGDHQVIYLCKLLETSQKFHPGALDSLLSTDMFSYANVPYRIKDYDAILANPFNSIDYDEKLEQLISQRVIERGSDGKVVWNKNGDSYLVNLTEKLLVTALAKMANFVPEGGIWMNTQRPEWNDANNALAGCGLSMVTLYYLRRYATFCKRLFENTSVNEFAISEEVALWLKSTMEGLKNFENLLSKGFALKERKDLLDCLANAASYYRLGIYKNGFSGQKVTLSKVQLIEFQNYIIKYADQSINKSKRVDNLYHAYNILNITATGLDVLNLPEMLEGQVAVLSSGALDTDESVSLLKALRNSALYRVDQNSYMLYPDKQLPRFEEKNNISTKLVEQSELLKKLIEIGDTTIIEKDCNGNCHFNGSFTNKSILNQSLENLKNKRFEGIVQKEHNLILDIYEQVFAHKLFTGRSGTFYSFEGLGCIYWHMNAKLLLSVEEIYFTKGTDNEILKKLYYEIRSGFGMNKTPQQYGAFPTDPYSHTPGHSGAQQPGMTGQVKEDIISRLGELGLQVNDGKLSFNHALLDNSEFLQIADSFTYFDVHGNENVLNLETNSLAFTFCQVPIVISKSNANSIILFRNGNKETIEGLHLNENTSKSIFERRGEIQLIEVNVGKN